MTGAGVEGFEAEVVENEQIGAAERFDKARMSPIAPGERQVLAQLRPAMIEDGAIVAAGFLADGAGQPALADAGRADQGQIVVRVDPFALRELLEQGAIETAGGAMMTPVGRLVMLRATDKRDLVRLISYVALSGLAAPVLGPPVGGAITTYLGWRWIFFLNLPLGLIGTWMRWP